MAGRAGHFAAAFAYGPPKRACVDGFDGRLRRGKRISLLVFDYSQEECGHLRMHLRATGRVESRAQEPPRHSELRANNQQLKPRCNSRRSHGCEIGGGAVAVRPGFAFDVCWDVYRNVR